MTDLRIQLADLIAALVDRYQHAETYLLTLRSPAPGGVVQEVRVHRTSHASLLEQLGRAVEPSSSGKDGMRGGYSGHPTAQLAAIDRLQAIAKALHGHADGTEHTRGWLDTLNLPARGTLDANLRSLTAAQTVPHDLITDARRWLTWARLVTGWETPPRTMKEPCPHCDTRGSIRIRVDADASSVEGAWCTNCDNTWNDPAEIAMLAQYIRWCNGELDTNPSLVDIPQQTLS